MVIHSAFCHNTFSSTAISLLQQKCSGRAIDGQPINQLAHRKCCYREERSTNPSNLVLASEKCRIPAITSAGDCPHRYPTLQRNYFLKLISRPENVISLKSLWISSTRFRPLKISYSSQGDTKLRRNHYCAYGTREGHVFRFVDEKSLQSDDNLVRKTTNFPGTMELERSSFPSAWNRAGTCSRRQRTTRQDSVPSPKQQRNRKGTFSVASGRQRFPVA